MTVHSPIPDFAAAREAMVECQLRPQGVTDPAVAAAMGRIKREKFLPSHTRPLAYVDRAVAMGEGRFLPARSKIGRSTRLNSSHSQISYAVFCLKKKKKKDIHSQH